MLRFFSTVSCRLPAVGSGREARINADFRAPLPRLSTHRGEGH